MAQANKNRLNTNSNVYTIIYSIILVVLVAFVLAFVFQALKPTQDANVALDKKKQILYALNIRGLDDPDAAAKYKEVVLADEIIDAQGNVIDKGRQGGEEAAFKLNSADFKAGKLALYVCKVDGQTKYVIPVYGMGLWGAINGYVAINADKATVFGTYFNHDSETAGLGAEIKDSQAWQEKFQGKKLFAQDASKIALAVNKKVDDPTTQVDGITGATLTSDGVTEMLQNCIGAYIKFLTAK